MAKSLKNCGSLTESGLKLLHQYSLLTIKNGKKNVHEIVKEFYLAMSFREPQSRALLTGNLPLFLFRAIAAHQSKNQKSLSKEENNAFSKMYIEAASLSKDFSDTDNIFSFIEENIVAPLTEGIEGESDEEGNPEADAVEDPSNEAPDGDLEEKLKTRLNPDEESLLDEEQENENFDYRVSEADLVTNALIHRKGISLSRRGESIRAEYRKIKGVDHVELFKDGVSMKTIPLSQFIDEYGDWYFSPDELNSNPEEEEKFSRVKQFKDMLQWLRRKLTVAYGNAIDKVLSAKSYFKMEGKKLVPGEIAQEFSRKNQYFSRIFDKGAAATLIDGLHSSFHPSANFTLEISDYEHTEKVSNVKKPYMNVVVEYKGSDGKNVRMIVANIAPPSDNSQLVKEQKETAEVQAYRENYNALVKKLQASPDGKITLDKRMPVSRIFLPISSSLNAGNAIYETEKDRVSGDRDKAHKLSLKNGVTLLKSMGFSVSPVMIDLNRDKKSQMAGQAFILTSPFHDEDELKKIIKNNSNWTTSKGLHDFAMDHNLNIIYLKRKELSFDDYSNALHGNLNPGRFKRDKEEITEYKKISAMFNPTQSYYILRRVAVALEAIEKKIASSKGDKSALQDQFERMVVFFFNGLHSHGVPIINGSADLDILTGNLSIREGLKAAKNAEPIPVELLNSAMATWQNYKNASGTTQASMIKQIAIRRFGWFSNAKDEVNQKIRQQKIDSLRYFNDDLSNQPKYSDNSYVSEGGMTGSEIVLFFDWLRANPELQKVAKAAFDSKTIRNAEEHFPTFNPVLEGTKVPMAKLGQAAPISPGINSGMEEADLNNEFLEIDQMPMMPHLVLPMDKLANSAGISSVTEPTFPGGDSSSTSSINDPLFDGAGRRRRRKTSEQRFIKDAIDVENDFLNEQEAIALTRSMIGDLADELSFGKNPLKMKDQVLLGEVAKNLFWLHSQDGKVKERVLRHEIFHKVLNELLDAESYQKIINEGRSMMAKEYGRTDFTNEEVDEYLAERYESSYGTHGNRFLAKLPSWLRTLFNGLKNLYRRLAGNYSGYQALLEKLEQGGFAFSPVRYDHYNGDSRYKKYSKSILDLSMELGWGENEDEILLNGREEFNWQINILRQQGLGSIFQKENIFIENGKKLLSISKAMDLVKQQREIRVRNTVKVFEPSLENASIQAIYNYYNTLTSFELEADEDLLDARNFAKTTELIDSLKEYAFDFYDFSSKTEEEFTVDLDPELLKVLDEDAQTDAKVHQLADRGALSGVKTMNKKVKFHLASTLIEGTWEPISVEKASSVLVEVVNKNIRKNGAFDMQGFIKDLHDKIQNLSFSPNSLEYKTMKAVWNKYFSPVPVNGVDSFLTMANKTSEDAELRAYYKRHMDVVVALLSSYSTVKIVEFMRPNIAYETTVMNPTSTQRGSEIKNEYNSNYIHNSFTRVAESDTTFYRMNSDTIGKLFAPNASFGLSFSEDSVNIKINSKTISIPKSAIKRSASTGYWDIDQSFIQSLLENESISPIDFHPLLRAMGFNISLEVSIDYLRAGFNSRKSNENAIEFVDNILMSYLIMAREMMNQEGKNPDAKTSIIPGFSEHGGKQILENIGYQRTDEVKLTVREEERGNAEVEITQVMFTPLKFSEFFKEIGDAQALSRIGSASSFEIIGGQKHTKDKINTPLMERIDSISEIKADIKKAAKEANVSAEEYIRSNFPNLKSNLFSNSFLDGTQEMSGFYQLQTLESRDNNVTKSFLDFNDPEFYRLLLSGALSGKENGKASKFDSGQYWHPLEIQADRGYLPFMALKKLFTSGFDPETGLKLNSPIIRQLENIYGHSFNLARNILLQIAKEDTQGLIKVSHPNKKLGMNNIPLATALNGDLDHALIAEYFKQVDTQLNAVLSANSALRISLPENGVWQKIKGQYQLNRLVNEKIKFSFDQFLAEEERKFKRFASKAFEIFSTGNNFVETDLDSSKVYEAANKHFRTKIIDEEGNEEGERSAKLFNFKKVKEIKESNNEILEKIAELEQGFSATGDKSILKEIKKLEKGLQEFDIMMITHPAVMDMYFNYRVNNLMVRQLLYGELHTFNPTPGMQHLEAGYVPEYSKRITGAGTSKINLVFSEKVQVPHTEMVNGKPVTSFVEMDLAPEGLPKKIDVLNLENVMYDMAENPSFRNNIMESRTNIGELRQKLAELDQATSQEEYAAIQKEIADIEQDFSSRSFKVDDGAIYTSQLFMSLARNSMGNTEGFPIKAIMKLTLNNVDLGTGNVDYDKALSVVLTPEYMDEVDSVHELYLQAMYSKGLLLNDDGSTISLWDIYEFNHANTKNRMLAEQAVLREYLKARKEGRILQEPAMYVNNRSTTKSTLKKINPNPISLSRAGLLDDNYLPNLIFDQRDLSEGTGAVLDLTSDINDKDIALSSQMLYLLGIVGNKNTFSVQETYKALSKISGYNSRKIAREIDKIKVKYGIENESEMVRAWALDVIRSSYEKQGDFGSGYRLSEDPRTQSVSHPMHKNKMFGAISAEINKGIGVRVKGFKGIQLPATNMLFLYETPKGTMTLSQARKVFKDVDALIESGDIVKRNLRFAELVGGKITQTEIISGNFLAKKFGTGKKTINEIFTITLTNGNPMNFGGAPTIEAADFNELQETKINSKGDKVSAFRKKLFNAFKSQVELIDWKGNIGVKNAIKKLEKDLSRLKSDREKIKDSVKEADIKKLAFIASQIENKSRIIGNLNLMNEGMAVDPEQISSTLYEIADVYVQMNRMLYGVMTRIPNTGKNSNTVFRVRAFIDSHENGMFVPAEWLEITGSDHDGDSAMMWHFGSNSKVAEDMLESTINILSDPENAREIFSDIDTDMDYVKGFAKQKSMESMAKGNGYSMDDLFTLNEVRANNGVGSTMTGSSALVSKTYSYAYITKMEYLRLGGNLENFIAPNIRIEEENPSSRPLNEFTGVIPEMNISGKYVYKWLETMTNSAIDNAKHLVMGALNIKRYNSDLHSAMVFLGFSKETVAKFFNHPTVLEVFKKAESYADSGANFYSNAPLSSAINFMINQMNGDERPNSFTTTDFETSMGLVSELNNQNQYDQEYILHLLNVLNHYGKDFREIQNVLKVSDQVKGMPEEQRDQFDKIMSALGFKTYAQVEQFINDYEQVNATEKGNLLSLPQLKEGGSNRLINPRLVVALNPNLMAALKSHMEFINKTHAHLLYSEPMVRLRNRLEKMIPKKILSKSFYKGKIDQAFYHHFAGMFFETGVKTEVNGKTYEFKNLEHRVAYLFAFKDLIARAKVNPKYRGNAFIDEITFDGNMPEIKMSHNFDLAQENIMLNDFRRLDPELKDQIFYFLLLTEGLNFKKHGIVKFITPETHLVYNNFLKKLENNPDKIWDGENMDAFIHSFFVANKDMAPEFIVRDITPEAMPDLGYKVNGHEYGEAAYRPLFRSKAFEKSTIPANENLEALVDAKFKINSELKSELSKLQLIVNAAKSSVEGKTETMKKNLRLLFDIDTEEGEIQILSLEAELLSGKKEIELFEDPDWSESQRKAYSYLMRFPESIQTSTEKLLKAKQDYQQAHEKAFTDEVDEMIQNGDLPVKNRSPYRLVKMWEGGKMLSALYKLSIMENSKGEPKLVWRKVRTYNAILDMQINLYRPGKITPTLLHSESIRSIDFNEYTMLQEGRGNEIPNIAELKGKNTNFLTKINEDGSMTSFQLGGTGKAESVQKIKSIVRVIQKAFPGIEVRMVRNQSGVYAKAKGWVNQGVIYLNLDHVTSDTPIHEAGHILLSMIRQSSPELYEKLMTMAKGHPMFDEISTKYKVVGNTDMDNAEETLVTLLGHSQSQLLQDSIDNNGPYAVKLIRQFWNTLKQIYRDVMKAFGSKTGERFEELLDQISEKKDLQSVFEVIGKAIIDGKVVSDISSRQIAKLENAHGVKNNTKFSKADIQKKINELIDQGIVTRTCKK